MVGALLPEGKSDPPNSPRVQSRQYHGSFQRAGSSSLPDSNAIADRRSRLDDARGCREYTLRIQHFITYSGVSFAWWWLSMACQRLNPSMITKP